ncbi:MAG: hypothetical protein WC045_02660 [Patescibacteria group bacterium]
MAGRRKRTVLANAAKTALKSSKKDTKTHGFEEVLSLGPDDTYDGSADMVMLVWHQNQITPAESYRIAQFPEKKTALAICANPNVQKKQLGSKAAIYHFNAASSGSAGK